MAIPSQNIMDTLRFMEDADLYKFADLHQNDPFLFPLALQESESRKKLRTAKQAQGGQEQPKVVAQALQQMAPQQPQPQAQVMPEDVGIAKLNAPNMENFADGGIVAFDEGGEVPRFQSQGYVKYPYGTVGEMPGGLYDLPGLVVGQPFGEQAGDAALTERINRIEANPRMRREDKDALIAQARQELGLPKTTTIPPTTPVPMGAKPTVTPAPTTLAPTTTQTSPRIEKESGVVDKAIERKRLEDEAAAAGRKLPAEPGLPSLNAAMKQYEGTVYKNAPDKETLQKEFAAIDKPYVDKMQASIDKEAKRLSSDKEQDFYMSLIQGGLAAAGGNSQYALQNIAQGFATGAGSYKEALKDFRKATQENTKAEAELARFQASGNKEALKSYYDQVAKRDDRYAQGVAGIIQQNMASSATLGAAKLNRDSMTDYRNIQLEQQDVARVQNIYDKHYAEVINDVRFKTNAAAAKAEARRRTDEDLKKFPRLAQYASTPDKGGATPTLKYNEKTGQLDKVG